VAPLFEKKRGDPFFPAQKRPPFFNPSFRTLNQGPEKKWGEIEKKKWGKGNLKPKKGGKPPKHLCQTRR